MQITKAAIGASAANWRFVPQPVNLGNKSRCGMLEWLVFTPRSGAESDAVAAIFVLRAHAARKPNSQNGLKPDIRRTDPNLNNPHRSVR